MGGTVPVCLQAPRDQRGADNFCFASGLTSINHTHTQDKTLPPNPNIFLLRRRDDERIVYGRIVYRKMIQTDFYLHINGFVVSTINFPLGFSFIAFL
jgi:hypothetical protein